MKHKLLLFLLAAAVAAYGQGHGHGAGGGPPAGAGAGAGAGMGAGHGSAGEHGAGMGHGDADRDHDRMNANKPDHSGKTPDQLLSQNEKLSSKLQGLLPNGTTPSQACAGFKNLGQCVAAIHVSQNLNIPFADLKAKTTGANAESLGQAIHDLKPDADAKAETKKAKKQADQDLKS